MQGCCYLDDSDFRGKALNPGESFIIQAPAGSGKTELLTNRILSLLSIVSKPEEILAITFTRKAVLEMRARVIEKLKLGLYDMPNNPADIASWELSKLVLERDSLFGWDLLKYPDRINIKTFDSLSFELVSSFPLLSGISGIPNIAEDAKKYYKAAAFATIDLADSYPCIRSLIARLDIDIKSVVTCITDMLGMRDQWLPILKYGFSRDLLQEELHLSIERDIAKLLSLMPSNWMEDLQHPIRMASSIICEDNANSILVNLLDWDCSLAPNINNLKKIKALASILLTSQNTLRSPKGLNKKNGFPAGSAHKKIFSEWLIAAKDNDYWVVYLAMLRYATCDITENQWVVLSDQLNVLLLSAANLLLQFRQHGALDFIEISQKAIAVLGKEDNPSDLLLKVDSIISHILVDEFQDTNHLHFELLRVITSGWQKDCGKSIFIVGDPMQSIYKFRGADVGLFLNVVEHGIGDIKLLFLKLVSNFRSQLNLVNWTNSVFSRLFPAINDENIGAVSYNPSVSVNPKIDGPAVSFHPLFIKNRIADDELEKFSLKIISQILESAQTNNLESTVILVPSRSSLGNLINILSKGKIPFRAIDMTLLSEKPIVSDLTQIIRALVHPGDRLAWFSVLRSPFCGLMLETLHKVFGSDHKTPVPIVLRKILEAHESRIMDSNGYVGFLLENEDEQKFLSSEEYNRLVRVAYVLLHSEYTGAFPFSAWIRYLWDLLGGSNVYDDPDADSDAENIFCLIDKIAAYGNIDVDAFEDEISNLLITSDQFKSGEPFVEIMTIHKAKGLQFDNVILYGIHNSSGRNRAPLMRFECHLRNVLFAPIKSREDDGYDPIAQYLGYRDKVMDGYELDRLIYVAVTRAKQRIHIISPVLVKDDRISAPSSDSLLIRLWDHLDYAVPELSDISDNSECKENNIINSLISRIVCDGSSLPEKLLVNYVTKPTWSYFWVSEPNDRSIIDRLIIDWLTRIGKTNINNYLEGFNNYLPIIKKQLLRRNFSGHCIEEASILIVNVIENFLKDDIGVLILSYNKSYRDLSLIDGEGCVFKIDVMLDLGSIWFIVEYNLSVIERGESLEDFVERIKDNYSEKLSKYCDIVSSIDARPSIAAVCSPFYKMLIYI